MAFMVDQEHIRGLSLRKWQTTIVALFAWPSSLSTVVFAGILTTVCFLKENYKMPSLYRPAPTR
jgi:hypothetical protein